MTALEWANLLGSVGEFVGAIAVLATLIYLAIQVKLSKEATEANTRQMETNRSLSLVENYMRRSERVEQGYRDLALSPDMAAIVAKANRGEPLEELEHFRLRDWCHAHMHRLDAQHYQYQHGLLEAEAYDNLQATLRRFAPIWRDFDVVPVRASFREEVAAALAAASADEPGGHVERTGTPTASFTVVALDHVVLRTDQPEMLTAFYCDLLQAKVERQVEDFLWQIRIGESLLDILRSKTASEGPANMDHFCLRIAPYDEAHLLERLHKAGIEAEATGEIYGAQGLGPSIYFTDPVGNRVELKSHKA